MIKKVRINQMYERWGKMYERWGLTYERFENAWYGWLDEQIKERFLIPPNAAGAAGMNKEQRNKE